MTQPNFERAKAKGAVGEAIVRAMLEAKGWVVYQPQTQGAHQFDMLCIKDKNAAIAFDVKAKARMNMAACTGINQTHFDEYARFSERHNMPFWVVFVDEQLGRIYGNSLTELERPIVVDGITYPWQFLTKFGKLLRLWSLDSMKDIAPLDEASVALLADLSQRNHEYKGAAA